MFPLRNRTFASLMLCLTSLHVVAAFVGPQSPRTSLPIKKYMTTTTTATTTPPTAETRSATSSALRSTIDDDGGPSDYDSSEILSPEKQLSIDTDEDDALIREELKRELLLLASVSDRGQFTSKEEKDIIIDLITQLEALNPSADPAYQCMGEWDLCLTNTQAFRSSPFFLAIRSVLNDPSTADNAFSLHEQATSIGQVGRVRQIINEDEFISEVDLQVGLMGGMPFSVKGTVVTKASYDIVAPEQWDLTVQSTQVKKSNVPFLDQFLDDNPVELPIGDVYANLRGSVPIATLKTYYVDDNLRITRDVDDNFFVFSRV